MLLTPWHTSPIVNALESIGSIFRGLYALHARPGTLIAPSVRGTRPIQRPCSVLNYANVQATVGQTEAPRP